MEAERLARTGKKTKEKKGGKGAKKKGVKKEGKGKARKDPTVSRVVHTSISMAHLLCCLSELS